MKSTICAAALAAASMLALTACGGGGGGTQPATLMPDPPVLSSDEIKAEVASIYRRSNTVIEERDKHSIWAPQREAGPLPEQFADLTDALEGEYEFGATEEGMSIAGAVWETTDPRGRWTYAHISFGIWMEHSFFLTHQTLALDPVFDEISVYLDIFSIGAATGSNPSSGSATWEGIMAGFDEGYAGRDLSRLEREVNGYVGNASLTLNSFENPTIDVLFSNIISFDESTRLRDVRWTDLPVIAGGFEGAGILGRFYGPQHEEVGGVFQFDAINGAFGAVRE